MADLARLYDFVAGNVIDSEQVDAEFNQLIARINDIDSDSLQAALAALLGVSQTGVVRRGKSIISASESRTNTAYGLLPTPDRVSGLVLPTDGLIAVAYQGTWQGTVANAASAAIFVGANQLVRALIGPIANQPTEATIPNGVNIDYPFGTSAAGLRGGGGSPGGSSYGGPATTGQVVGGTGLPVEVETFGITHIFAAAGTYDISVQFKATSGSVTVKNRRLWAWTLGF